MRRIPGAVLWLLLAAVWTVGCGGDDEPSAVAAIQKPQPAPAVTVQTVQKPAPSIPALELRLDPGQRFPLRKVVEQTLTQHAGAGPSVGRTRLELWLEMTVEEVASDGRKRLRVDYRRVHYRHDVPGEWFEFDSAQPGAPVPVAAVPYRGLVGNGFSFWIGRDNRMAEVVGFGEFLGRCVRDVPAEHRPAVLDRFSRLVDTAEIANFVDDSIGLLPAAAERAPRVGDAWSRERRLGHALPLHLTSQCTLTELNDRTAEIDIAGHFAPTAVIEPIGGIQAASGLRISVRGGHAIGHCTIERRSGLPLRSKIEHHVEMLVEPVSGAAFVQHKHLVTTIESFPEQRATRADVFRAAAEPVDLDPPSAAGASGSVRR